MLQLLAFIFTCLGALFSLKAGIKAQPLIPDYQFRLRDLRHNTNLTNERLKELTTLIISELTKSNYSKIEISALLIARLKNLEAALEYSINNLKEGKKASIFDEAGTKSHIRFYYLLSFVSIITAMVLQSIALYFN